MKLVIEADIPEKWVKSFVGMLNAMEVLGEVENTKIVAMRSEGERGFRPKFKFFTGSNSVRDIVPAVPLDNRNGTVLYGLQE